MHARDASPVKLNILVPAQARYFSSGKLDILVLAARYFNTSKLDILVSESLRGDLGLPFSLVVCLSLVFVVRVRSCVSAFSLDLFVDLHLY